MVTYIVINYCFVKKKHSRKRPYLSLNHVSTSLEGVRGRQLYSYDFTFSIKLAIRLS